MDRYAIWNEPNWDTLARARQRTPPSIYRSLYTAGYKAVKAADPRAKVLIGELAPQRRRARDRAAEVPARVTCSKPTTGRRAAPR